MRFDPLYLNNVVSALDATSTNEENLINQLSSGVSLNSLSDNPVAAGENVLLTAQLNANDTYSQTASLTEGSLQVADSALSSVVTQLTDAITLATEVNDGTLNSGDINTITNQLTSIRSEVLSLANSSYQGRYIFAGSQGSTTPFTLDTTTTPATVNYNGDDDVSYVQTPGGQQIATNIPGSQLFNASGNSVLGALNQIIGDLSSGASSTATTADLTGLNNALDYVTQQRATLDDSITQLTASGNYASSQTVQLQSAQDTLLQTNTAQVASQLSSAETQQASLTQVIAAMEKQGTLFDVI
jgi:flagellar hook-associated protein 3 FlgL